MSNTVPVLIALGETSEDEIRDYLLALARRGPGPAHEAVALFELVRQLEENDPPPLEAVGEDRELLLLRYETHAVAVTREVGGEGGVRFVLLTAFHETHRDSGIARAGRILARWRGGAAGPGEGGT